mgnify:CR=1 FL=1
MKLLLGLFLLVASMNTFAACSKADECTVKKDCEDLNIGATPAKVVWKGDKCVAIASNEVAPDCTAVSGANGAKTGEAAGAANPAAAGAGK